MTGITNDAASLWWSWTPSTSTNVFIDTIGSKIDTVLAVYTGSTLTTHINRWRRRAAACRNLSRRIVSFNAQAGVPYRIAVASVNSNSVGSLVLHITPGGQLDTSAHRLYPLPVR